MKKEIVWVLFLIFIHAVSAHAGSDSPIYTTWDNMELDKCASVWLIKRFIDTNATFKFIPKGEFVPEGIPFDTPEAEIRRYHNMAAFEFILRKHKIEDPALKKIGEIIHDIEINYWGKKKYEESLKLNNTIQEIISDSNSPEESIKRSFTVFETMYVKFKQKK